MSSINSKLYSNYETFGQQRGRLVVHVLSSYIVMPGSRVLDFGAGTGGIALECARAGATVHAIEPNAGKACRLVAQAQAEHLNVSFLDTLPVLAQPYDAIVLLDVIEHLQNPEQWLHQLRSLLKPNGVIYMSTPNKFSPAHLLLDPHFSVPLLSLASRRLVKWVTADVLKWQPSERQDFPELFSFSTLMSLFSRAGFETTLVNRTVLDYAIAHPRSVWNRPLHLRLVRLLQQNDVGRWLKWIVTDGHDGFNRWLNPTWYMILQKKARFQTNRA